VVTIVSHGCPVPAIEAAFELQAQTVREWVEAAGVHTEAVHHTSLVAIVAACAQWAPLFLADGLRASIDVVHKAFRTRQTGTPARACSPGRTWPSPKWLSSIGITDHVWTVSELLHYRVPPPRWEPPRRRENR
jgi:hypothetical protein